MNKKLKILLVIDIQKQFKDNNGNYEKIIDYIKNFVESNIKITIFQEFVPEMKIKSLYIMKQSELQPLTK